MKRPFDRRLVLVALLLLAASAAAVWFLSGRQQDASLPKPDLKGAHAKVTAKLARLEREVLREPSSSERWGELGMLLMAHGWNDEAAAAFETAEQLAPGDARWPYLRAILLEMTDLQKAEQAYAHAATIDPNYAPLRYRWALVLMRQNKHEAAEKQLRIASQLAPQSPQPLLALGRAALARNDVQEALDLFQKAADVAPLCREAHEQVARAHFLLGDKQQAAREQELAATLPAAYPGLSDPISEDVRRRELVARQSAERADQLAAQGDVAAAAAAFQQLIEDRPDLSRPRLNLATLYAMQGDSRTAAAMFHEITELFPQEALAYQGLAATLEQMGDVQGAIAAYRESVRLKPDYAQGHFALGLLWEREGKLQQATTAYRAAVNADAGFAPAHLALGVALQNLGELDAAVAAIENAARLAPNDAVPRDYLRKALRAREAGAAASKTDKSSP